ncbi:MAG: hypothetical protein ABI614_24400 [Planctomycetota bacterium]
MSLDNSFPNLSSSRFEVTSEFSLEYNCIAWAAGDDARWWWPTGGGYWPIDNTSTTSGSYLQAFATIGYVPADDAKLETDYEKVALYAKEGHVAHAARQLANGQWTSKLGSDVDIEHDLRSIEGEVYGTVVQLLKRPRATTVSVT